MVRGDLHISENDICIFTLGRFYICHDNIVLNENSNRSRRMWEIFKFLLSHHKAAYFPETILAKIQPEKEYPDPSLVMRAQIFRLKHALNECPADNSLADNIILSQGCYSWEVRTKYWLDADELESLANKAGLLLDKNPDEAINLYRKAIALYKGPYLSELSFSEWLEPIRSYYHDIFMNCVFELIELLKTRKAYKEIIKICEQANAIDYFEEKLHVQLIEALLVEGEVLRARIHYNEVTSVFYRELGIKPSEHMKSLYRLVAAEPGRFELDLMSIQEGLRGSESVKGAYLCDSELFRYFYKLERARIERSGQSSLLGLYTITDPDYRMPDDKTLNVVIQQLQDIALNSLRKIDIVTRWNKAQLLILLPGLKREQAEMVISRIETNFLKKYSLKGLVIHKKIESLLPDEHEVNLF